MKFTMSHHIVTVCVVCVLCAAHVPCSAHTNPSGTVRNSTNTRDPSSPDEQSFSTLISSQDTSHPDTNSQSSYPNNFVSNKRDTVRFHSTRYVNRNNNNNNVPVAVNAIPTASRDAYLLKKEITENFKGGGNARNTQSSIASADVSVNSRDVELLERLAQTELSSSVKHKSSADLHTDYRSRLKRDVAVDEMYFMKKIFEAYGDGTSITMDGFEKLVRKLGLLRLLTDASKLENGSTETSNNKNYPNNGLHDVDSKNNKERCLNSQELLSTVAQDTHYTFSNNATTMPSWLFERVCPALVYQLAAESSSERNGCIRVPENYKPVSLDKFYTDDSGRNTFKVWIYSTISIFIISLSGLLGVAVIPIMKKNYYHHVLQFLVALAVGTLTGDALIHLLPHAMMPSHHEHDEHDDHREENTLSINHVEQHNSNMWKGLVAMMGLVFFFFTEKALIMLAEWRKRRQRRNKLPTRVRVMRESDGPNSNVVGEKLCKHKYSSYPYCYGEIASETQDNHHNRQINHHERPPIIEEEKPLTSNCNSTKIVNDMEKKPKDDWRLDDSIINNAKKNTDGANVSLNESESYTVIIREHENKHHGHSHSHGHVHSAPESMSSVAWMVVMGDGLHNFTDGMAIGAAFSANIAGGFSTAIAVLCHELPHELGDFAVLLRAGMSIKQAIFYNVLSSVLCLFGMIFGVSLGSTPAATNWLFAAAAGIFIYIALVDMIPELSSSHSAEGGSRGQCILQGLGLSTGLGIMLLIAAYEHDLKHIFDD
ncbi:zinc transporter foi isoform X2 [Camponotus floridanus]|uniref:zinc transporter foi isoform X3 n=1 Tax=Camponotus floridanus TaxID=104421 RepID=UPI00059C802A|nr:zinc transporter foi isoform X3 [Camponotus floridanus]XP_019885317.1 zinc transporter foi isoform X2 [Camponotus floridanus]